MNFSKTEKFDVGIDISMDEAHSYKERIEEWRNVLKIKGFSKANIAALSDQEIEDLLNEIDLPDFKE